MTTTPKLVLALLLAVAGSVACAPQISTIRGSDAAAVDQAPLDRTYVGGRPGGQALVARTFEGQPPLIPHTIGNYDEITSGDNPCLECHISDELKGKKMPRVADTHLVPGKKDNDGNPVLDMTRWQCNTCHVAQVDAKPLVDNDFVGYTKKR